MMSFYLYDHLGNTRVVYTPEVQCPTYVTYTIDHVADYYPYGKVLREFVTTANGEKFLTTQHERDFETGLDYRGARFYDADVARFLSLDPLAADYPSLSDYCYVAANPVMLIDPTGMAVEDYYSVDENGNLKLERKTNDDYDILFKRDTKGQYIEGSAIRVNDKSLLVGLKNGEFYKQHFKMSGESEISFGYRTESQNKEEIMKLYLYMSDNTSVEWSLMGVQSKNGPIYILGTYNDKELSPGLDREKYDPVDLLFTIHTHPDKNGTKGGSGEVGDGVHYGDMDNITTENKKFKELGIPLYEHYVYHKYTKTIYRYTPTNKRIKIKKVISYKSLLFLK